jgi:hypothetical protein
MAAVAVPVAGAVAGAVADPATYASSDDDDHQADAYKSSSDDDEPESQPPPPPSPRVPGAKGKGPMMVAVAAKRARVDLAAIAEETFTAADVGDGYRPVPFPEALKTHNEATTILVVNEGININFPADAWGPAVKRMKALLEGPVSQQKNPSWVPYLSRVQKLDAKDSRALQAIKDAYAIRPDMDISTMDHSRRMVYRVPWPVSNELPCAAESAYILVDDTHGTAGSNCGAGMAVVYNGSRFFVRGPREDCCGDEADFFNSSTTLGEVTGFSPSAACLLTLICDMLLKVTSSKRPRKMHLAFRVVFNSPSPAVEKLFQTAAAEFSHSVMTLLYTTVAATVAASATNPVFALPAPVVISPLPKALPKYSSPAPATVEKGDHDLASLCDTIRSKGMPSVVLKAKVSLWVRMFKMPVGLPPCAPPGNPGVVASLEAALGEMVAFIKHAGWGKDIIHDIEGDLCL